MNRKFRVAVIGAGIGRAHVIGYSQLPDAFEVACVCDLNLARAEEAASLAQNAKAVTSLDDVLADPAIDIVDICLPPGLHVSMSIKALEAGKHVVCEKPIAGSLADMRKLMAVAAKSVGSFFPVFQYRYGRSYLALYRLKQAGVLGRPHIIALETHWQRGADYYAELWRGTWAGELGGVIVSHACHLHNLATHLAGDVREVAAFLDTRVNPIETEDCAAISMKTVEGALVTSSITLGAAGNSSRLRACFEQVTVTSTDEPYNVCSSPWTFQARDSAIQARIDEIVDGTEDVPPRFPGLFADIYRHLTGQPDVFLPTIAEGFHSTELMTAIYTSARGGKSIVQLPLGAGHDDRDFEYLLRK